MVNVEEIYQRNEWPTAAAHFSGFLKKYKDANGEKYWD